MENFMKGSLAKTMQTKELVQELVEADNRAHEWHEEHEKIKQFNLNFKEPPIDLGRYYKDFCSRNPLAYRDFKTQGIKGIVEAEERRFEKKIDLQDQARRRDIKPDKMLQFEKEYN